jgi:hypothetical protein
VLDSPQARGDNSGVTTTAGHYGREHAKERLIRRFDWLLGKYSDEELSLLADHFDQAMDAMGAALSLARAERERASGADGH